MIVDWIELGRGIGWFGGILYLIGFVERRIRMYLMERQAERFRVTGVARGVPSLPADWVPPKIHIIRCQLCGENAAQSAFGCKHPAAPAYEHMAPVPISKQDQPKP